VKRVATGVVQQAAGLGERAVQQATGFGERAVDSVTEFVQDRF